MHSSIKIAGGIAIVLATNAISLWFYHDHYASKPMTVDLEDVLKDHVNRYGRIGLTEKQAATVAKSFGHAMESGLSEYEQRGYLVLVKQAVVKGEGGDLTVDLKNRIEAEVAPVVAELQSGGAKSE